VGILRRTGLPSRLAMSNTEFIIVPAQRSILSGETARRLEDTLHHVVKPAFAPALSAATNMAARRGASQRAEAPVSVAEGRAAEEEEDRAAGVDDQVM